MADPIYITEHEANDFARREWETSARKQADDAWEEDARKRAREAMERATADLNRAADETRTSLLTQSAQPMLDAGSAWETSALRQAEQALQTLPQPAPTATPLPAAAVAPSPAPPAGGSAGAGLSASSPPAGGSFAPATATTTAISGAGAQAGANAPRDLLDRYGNLARQKGFGDEGAKALQAVLVTEGGLPGAIGDTDRSTIGSHGPLQFYEKGQLANFARQHGMGLEQAGAFVRANPDYAVNWALDTYMGRALREGLGKGLSGADLATYIQRHGQVSESPERAGKNYLALFGNQPAQQARATTAPGGATVTRAASGERDISQFGDPTLTAAEAYAACGPAAAARLAAAYGNSIPLSAVKEAARLVGWRPDQGMAGIQSQKKLLDNLGIPAELDMSGNRDKMVKAAQQGIDFTISTPGHYFSILPDPASGIMYDADGSLSGKAGAFYVGSSGTDLRGGSRWMTLAEMEKSQGGIQGAIYANATMLGAKQSTVVNSSADPTAAPNGAAGTPSVQTDPLEDLRRATDALNQAATGAIRGVRASLLRDDWATGGLTQGEFGPQATTAPANRAEDFGYANPPQTVPTSGAAPERPNLTGTQDADLEAVARGVYERRGRDLPAQQAIQAEEARRRDEETARAIRQRRAEVPPGESAEELAARGRVAGAERYQMDLDRIQARYDRGEIDTQQYLAELGRRGAGRVVEGLNVPFGAVLDATQAGAEKLYRDNPDVFGSAEARHAGRVANYSDYRTEYAELEPLTREERAAHIEQWRREGRIPKGIEIPLAFDRDQDYRPMTGRRTAAENLRATEPAAPVVPERLGRQAEEAAARSIGDFGERSRYGETMLPEMQREIDQAIAGITLGLPSAAMGAAAGFRNLPVATRAALATGALLFDPVGGTFDVADNAADLLVAGGRLAQEAGVKTVGALKDLAADATRAYLSGTASTTGGLPTGGATFTRGMGGTQVVPSGGIGRQPIEPRHDVPPSRFIEVRNRNPRAAFLTQANPEDLASHRLIVNGDEQRGFAGAAISPEGDIQNVFNVAGQSGAKQPGGAVEVMLQAIQEGGRTLDAFDGFLPAYYRQFGFVEDARVPFNRDYAPPGWDYARDGEPDVVLMHWAGFPNGETADDVRRRFQTGQKLPPAAPAQRYDEWDAAAAAREQRMAQVDAGGGAPVGGARTGQPAGEPGAGAGAGTRLAGVTPATAGRSADLSVRTDMPDLGGVGTPRSDSPDQSANLRRPGFMNLPPPAPMRFADEQAADQRRLAEAEALRLEQQRLRGAPEPDTEEAEELDDVLEALTDNDARPPVQRSTPYSPPPQVPQREIDEALRVQYDLEQNVQRAKAKAKNPNSSGPVEIAAFNRPPLPGTAYAYRKEHTFKDAKGRTRTGIVPVYHFSTGYEMALKPPSGGTQASDTRGAWIDLVAQQGGRLGYPGGGWYRFVDANGAERMIPYDSVQEIATVEMLAARKRGEFPADLPAEDRWTVEEFWPLAYAPDVYRTPDGVEHNLAALRQNGIPHINPSAYKAGPDTWKDGRYFPDYVAAIRDPDGRYRIASVETKDAKVFGVEEENRPAKAFRENVEVDWREKASIKGATQPGWHALKKAIDASIYQAMQGGRYYVAVSGDTLRFVPQGKKQTTTQRLADLPGVDWRDRVAVITKKIANEKPGAATRQVVEDINATSREATALADSLREEGLSTEVIRNRVTRLVRDRLIATAKREGILREYGTSRPWDGAITLTAKDGSELPLGVMAGHAALDAVGEAWPELRAVLETAASRGVEYGDVTVLPGSNGRPPRVQIVARGDPAGLQAIMAESQVNAGGTQAWAVAYDVRGDTALYPVRATYLPSDTIRKLEDFVAALPDDGPRVVLRHTPDGAATTVEVIGRTSIGERLSEAVVLDRAEALRDWLRGEGIDDAFTDARMRVNFDDGRREGGLERYLERRRRQLGEPANPAVLYPGHPGAARGATAASGPGAPGGPAGRLGGLLTPGPGDDLGRPATPLSDARGQQLAGPPAGDDAVAARIRERYERGERLGGVERPEPVTGVDRGDYIRRTGLYPEGGAAPATVQQTVPAEPAPTFFSQLERTAEQKLPGRANPTSIRAMLRNNGVKPDEMKWTGLDDMLDQAEQEGRVLTRQEVLDHIRQNNVQVREVMSGRDPEAIADIERRQEEARQQILQARTDEVNAQDQITGQREALIEDLAIALERNPDSVAKLPTRQARLEKARITADMLQRNPDMADEFLRMFLPPEQYEEYVRPFAMIQDARRRGDQADRAFREATREHQGAGTRYEHYTLPGGQRYRELLLTLPPKAPTGRVAEVQAELAAIQRQIQADPARMLSGGADDLLARRAALERELDHLSSGRGGDVYQSAHWGEPNVLAHVRFDDRVDADGKKVLFIEEIQSDWHQAGRKLGYMEPGYDSRQATARANDLNAQMNILETAEFGRDPITRQTEVERLRAQGDEAQARALLDAGTSRFAARNYLASYSPDYQALARQLVEVNGARTRNMNAVPDAPFQKTWPELAFKRMLRYAAEHGYDRIAWTTGQQQNERYDLAQYVEEITFRKWDRPAFGPQTGGEQKWYVEAIGKDGDRIADDNLTYDGIREMYGENIAQQIADSDEYEGTLSGVNLSVGGKGMTGFYDEMLPKMAAKLGKKWGATVGETRIADETPQQHAPWNARIGRIRNEDTGAWEGTYIIDTATDEPIDGPFANHAEAQAAWNRMLQDYRGKNPLGTPEHAVHSMDVTPAMKRSVMEEGQPLFMALPGDVTGLGDLRRLGEPGAEEQEEGEQPGMPPVVPIGMTRRAARQAAAAVRSSAARVGTAIDAAIRAPVPNHTPATDVQSRTPQVARLRREMADVSETIQGFIEANPHMLDALNRGDFSREDVLADLAQRVGVEPKWLRGRATAKYSDEELLGLRAAVANRQEAADALARDVQHAGGLQAVDDIRRVELTAALLDAARYAAVARGEAFTVGRTLNRQHDVLARDAAILAARRTRQDARDRERATRLLEKLGGRDVTDDMLDQYLAVLESGDPVASAKYVRGLARQDNWGRFQILRYASMLSASTTHLTNALGNTANLLADAATLPAAAGIDMAISAVEGTERTRSLDEWGAQWAGMSTGAWAGLKDAGTILVQGIGPRDAGKLENIRAGFQSGNDVVDFAAELPLRMLSAADAIFRGAARGAFTNRLAVRKAMQEGKRGQALANRAQEILQNLEDFPDLVDEADRLAGYTVLQESRRTTQGISSIINRGGEGAVGRAWQTVGNIAIPFVRTPYNIIAQGMEMTPVGALGALDAARKGDQGQTADRLAKMTLGTALLAAGGALAANGMLSGGYPNDPQDRAALPPGWQPYSLMLPNEQGGHTYVELAKLGPLAIPLAMGAVLGVLGRTETPDPGDVLKTLGRFVLDQTFVRGITDFAKAFTEPEKALERQTEAIATTFVPYAATLRQITRAMDLGDRDPKGAWQAIQSLTPWTAGNVPRRQDPLGREVHGEQTGLGAIISPLRYSATRSEPVIRAFADADLSLPRPPKTIRPPAGGDPLKLNESEQRDYLRIAGRRIEERTLALTQRPAWQTWSPKRRQNELEAIRDAATLYARNQVYQAIPADERRKRQWEEKIASAPAPRGVR